MLYGRRDAGERVSISASGWNAAMDAAEDFVRKQNAGIGGGPIGSNALSSSLRVRVLNSTGVAIQAGQPLRVRANAVKAAELPDSYTSFAYPHEAVGSAFDIADISSSSTADQRAAASPLPLGVACDLIPVGEFGEVVIAGLCVALCSRLDNGSPGMGFGYAQSDPGMSQANGFTGESPAFIRSGPGQLRILAPATAIPYEPGIRYYLCWLQNREPIWSARSLPEAYAATRFATFTTMTDMFTRTNVPGFALSLQSAVRLPPYGFYDVDFRFNCHSIPLPAPGPGSNSCRIGFFLLAGDYSGSVGTSGAIEIARVVRITMNGSDFIVNPGTGSYSIRFLQPVGPPLQGKGSPILIVGFTDAFGQPISPVGTGSLHVEVARPRCYMNIPTPYSGSSDSVGLVAPLDTGGFDPWQTYQHAV
jgi:hypothetical protein